MTAFVTLVLPTFQQFLTSISTTWDVGGTRDVGDLLLATRTSASVDERTSTAIAFVTNSLADVVTAGKGFPANLFTIKGRVGARKQQFFSSASALSGRLLVAGRTLPVVARQFAGMLGAIQRFSA